MTLAITDLKVTIGGKDILRGVDLSLQEGRVHGLAGESGSGKTMTGLAVLGLLPHGARATGSIALGGRELLTLANKELNQVRGGEVAMVFQDPATSLHPMLTIGRQLTEHMRHHLGVGKKEARARAVELLGKVRIPGAGGGVRALPAPVLRRHAAAHRHRDRAGLLAEGADRRRADDRAGRDRAGGRAAAAARAL